MERPELKALLSRTPGAEVRHGFVFLTDPKWPEALGPVLAGCLERARTVDAAVGWLNVPTGGTGGGLKFVRHDDATLTAAVAGFCRHFETQRVNALGVLPLHHVSGLMAWLRCVVTGGTYLGYDWKRLEAGDWPDLSGGEWFLSLVPTQLQRVLELAGGAEFLRRFRAVFLGGAPTWRALADAAAEARVPVCLSYGMSETAAMIAAQRPEEFASGRRDAGSPLPHASLTVDPDGVLRIEGPSVFRGYFPEQRESRVFVTEDLGELTPEGGVRVLGRRDAVIITGGEKVSPSEVEEALRALGCFEDVAVVGVPDPEWGALVVACFPGKTREVDPSTLRDRLGATLARYKHPKRYVPVDPWPRNAQGKVNRAALSDAVERALRG